MKTQIQLALEDVESAFRQFEFAIKLMYYCEDGSFDLAAFNTDNTILFATGSMVLNSCSTREEIVACSKINVGICFGASAIALNTAFELAGIDRSRHDAAMIVYMVRCAFAHNIADPKWEVRGKFLKNIDFPMDRGQISIDFTTLNGQPFKYEHIGDLPNWYRIKNVSIDIINSNLVIQTG